MHRRRPPVLAPAILLLLAAPSATQAVSTFTIEANTDYTDNGCIGADLSDSTIDLYNSLIAAGWTGFHYGTSSAWPQDVVESCTGGSGLDNYYGDAKLLSVFFGHGDYYSMAWGYAHNGICDVNPLSSPMRLGEMGGAQAGYFVAATCCLANAYNSSWTGWQHVWQIFGSHSVLYLDSGMVAGFFNATAVYPNYLAWLNNMEDRPGWFTGDNSVIVYNYGSSEQELWDTVYNAKLKAGVKNYPRPNSPICGIQPADNWSVYFLRDHGMAGCGL